MLDELRIEIEQLIEDKRFLERRLSDIENQLAQNIRDLTNIELVYGVFKEASKVSLNNLKDYLENLVNQVLKVLFPNDKLSFKLDFTESRGQIGCVITLTNQYNQTVDLFDAGGGRLDVINLILRLAFLKIKKHLLKLLVADEPLKHLDSDKQAILAELVEEICEDLKIQLIMVTHNTAYKNEAQKSKIFKIRR